MSKIKVKVDTSKNVYIHNDLMNVAYHLKEAILKKNEDNDEGINLDIMAALAILAFAYEAKINFIGHKKVEKWKERDSFKKKSSRIYSSLTLNPDLEVRPYSSIECLKKFRNYIAHGKPIEVSESYEKIIDQSDECRIDLNAGHEDFCTLDNFLEIYEDVNKVWKELLNAADIQLYETITSGSSGVTYIEHV